MNAYKGTPELATMDPVPGTEVLGLPPPDDVLAVPQTAITEIVAVDPRRAEVLMAQVLSPEVGKRAIRLAGGDTHLADDLVGELALRILKYAHRLSPDNMGAWMYLALQHIAIDRSRRKVTTEQPIDQVPELFDRQSSEAIDDLVERMELLSAIKTLPEGYREILLLYYWGDLKYEEVAKRMSIPLSTVKSRLFLARKALREALQETNTQD